jgi:class 3 adenylate cyclase
MCLKVEEGRFVAAQIPDSKYVELDGIDHLPFVGGQDEIINEIERFVASIRFGAEHDRVLATVMSVELGDSADAASARRQVGLFKGREIPSIDGGVLAAFDGPARAIRCASAIAERADSCVRIGLHTGECDLVGDTYSGFAVELARKIAQLATGEHILVSRTVKDLVAGSGLEFKEFGRRSFDDVDGEWRLFEVVTSTKG